MLSGFPSPCQAIVVGASGGIGAALADAIEATGAFERTVRLSRRSDPPLDLLDEATMERAAASLREAGPPVRLVLNATGFLHGDGIMPEKALSRLTREGLERNFQINAIGAGLFMRHMLPLLPREGRSIYGALTAKVGSIADNEIGGWYAYRAAKAAHNQLIRTAAVEIARTRPEAVLVALHPGTVRSDLSEPFAKAGLNVRDPAEAARDLLGVIDGLGPKDTGTFRGYDGATIPW